MQLCFVGMSGVGKSFWSRRLSAEQGFVVHDCDAAIGTRLGSIVTPEPGQEPVTALGRWMGMPWTAGYAEREARYLALEDAVTRDALAAMGDRHVLDATGSVIYLDGDLLAQIRSRCRVVYLRTPDERRAAMLRRYLDEPKPVVWAGAFRTAPGQPPLEALPAAYGELLALRDRRYAALAHVTLDGGELERAAPSTAELLRRIT